MQTTYGRGKPGDFLALVNSFGVVEIARAEGSAADGLGSERGAPLIIHDGTTPDLACCCIACLFESSPMSRAASRSRLKMRCIGESVSLSAQEVTKALKLHGVRRHAASDGSSFAATTSSELALRTHGNPPPYSDSRHVNRRSYKTDRRVDCVLA